MNFSLRQLRAFLMVAELQNFTRAAERIHLSQAALSLMIREFEEQIGFKVFDRSTRTVSINAAGLKIYPVVQKTVMDLEDAIREAENISKYKDNLVRVAATSIVSTNILPKVIAALKQSHPLIEIELRDVDRASIPSLVDQGAVDVGLGLNYSHQAHFQKVKIGTCGLLLAGKSTGELHLPAITRDIGFMHGKSIYALPADNTIQITIDAFLTTQGIESPIKTRFFNINTILAMIEANGGFAWLPSFTKEACQRYGLSTCLLTDHAHELEFGAILSNQSPMRESVASFLEAFRRSMDVHLK